MRMFIDCFDTGLPDWPRKKQSDMRLVAEHIAREGKFSAFEASANQTIARTMNRLCASGWFTLDTSRPYPWTYATLTAAGRDALGWPPAHPDDTPPARKAELWSET